MTWIKERLAHCGWVLIVGLLAAVAPLRPQAADVAVPLLGVTQGKNIHVLPLGDNQHAAGVLAADTYSLAPIVEDAGSAYYLSAAGQATEHTFDGANESGGANLMGTPGSEFVVLEGVGPLGPGLDRIIVEVRAVNSSLLGEPWVDIANAGTGLLYWTLEVGSGAGGNNPIEPGKSFTVIGSGFVIFNSSSQQLGAFDLVSDTSTATGLSGVASLGYNGADIAGVDLAAIQMYWDIQYAPADLAIQVVDAVDGSYAPGSQLTTFVGVENVGSEESAQSSFDLYASTDTTITDADRLLGTFVVPPIPPGGLSGGDAPTILPADLPTGYYFIGGILDIADADAANNVKHDPDPIFVSADPDIRVRPQSLSFAQPGLENAERGPDTMSSNTAVDSNISKLNVSSRFSTSPLFGHLVDRAASKGDVRVIVGFNAPFQAAGTMATGAQQLQQQEIHSRGNQLLSLLQGRNIKENRRFRYIPYMALSVDTDALQYLANSPLVASIEEDKLAAPTLASSNIVVGSPLAWAETYDGSGQTVAVLDSGVDKTHPWFSTGGSKVVSEACYSTTSAGSASLCPDGVANSTAPGSGLNCDPAISECDHGTHVAGIVAGNDRAGPDFGVARGADVIAIQVFSRVDDVEVCGVGEPPCLLTYTSDQVAALERVYELRDAFAIAAVNMSLGGGQYFDQAACDADNASTKTAIDNLRSVGIVTVISAGNDGWVDSIGAPGCISSAVSVGNSTDSDEIAAGSNIYPQLHLLAPGTSINSSVPGGGTAIYDGTSMAAPHVAGAWAVLRQLSPLASVDTILGALQSTATPVGDLRAGGIETGLMRINLDLAMGDTRTTFGIFNDGLVNLHVSSILPASPAPWITVVPAGPFDVPAGSLQVVQVSINYANAPAGESRVRLLITSNDPDEAPWPDGVYINVSTPKNADVVFADGFEDD